MSKGEGGPWRARGAGCCSGGVAARGPEGPGGHAGLHGLPLLLPARLNSSRYSILIDLKINGTNACASLLSALSTVVSTLFFSLPYPQGLLCLFMKFLFLQRFVCYS